MYAGEHKREPFLSLNPFGQMPALTDGAFTIADSHACLVYLARKYDPTGSWLPADAEGEAKVAEWLSKSANEVHQGPWMKRAKIRRPDAIKLSNEEIDARCDHILKLMDAALYVARVARARPADDRGHLLLRPDLDAQGVGLRHRQVAERDTLARTHSGLARRARHRRQSVLARTILWSRRRIARCRSWDRRSAGTRGRRARRCGRSRAASSSAARRRRRTTCRGAESRADRGR